MTLDPYKNSAGPKDPGSWNRYVYVSGDPINLFDSAGTCGNSPDTSIWSGSGVTVVGSAPCVITSDIVTSRAIGSSVGNSIASYDDLHGISETLCNTLPDARVVSVNIAAGAIGTNGFNFDLVINFLSGEISLTAGTGTIFGVGDGAGVTVSTGFVWNLGPDNHNYANINTTGNAQIPIPASGLSGTIAVAANAPWYGSLSTDPNKGFVIPGGISLSLASIASIPSFGIGGSYTIGVQDGRNPRNFWDALSNPVDRTLYGLKSYSCSHQ